MIAKVERDVMPRQVALELLCRPGKQSNRERKICFRALETHYISTRAPRDDRGQQILANRVKLRSISHLIKRHRRCVERRKLLQDAHVIVQRNLKKLESREGKPNEKEIMAILFLQRQSAELELRAKQVDMAWEVVTDELERRNKICQHKTTNSLA